MTDDYLHPSSRQRLRIAATLLIAFAAYLALKFGILRFVHFVAAKPVCAQIVWWRGFIVFFALVAIAFSARQVYTAIAALRCGQWPLPGTTVFFRTRIERGGKVKFHAMTMFVVAVAVLGLLAYVLALEPVRAMFASYPTCADAGSR